MSPASVSWVLGLPARATMPGYFSFLSRTDSNTPLSKTEKSKRMGEFMQGDDERDFRREFFHAFI
jgi:hypothetical protein